MNVGRSALHRLMAATQKPFAGRDEMKDIPGELWVRPELKVVLIRGS
jgi:hypothetical protein